MTRCISTVVRGLVVALLLAALVAMPGAATAGEGERVPGGERAEIGFGRWLDLRVGMTSREAIRTGKVRLRQGPCETTNLVAPWDDRGYLFFRAGRLRWLTLFTGRERTAGGVGVGSTLREIRRAHPGLSGVRAARIEGYRLPYVTVRKRAGTITFQFPTDARVRPRTRARVVNVSGDSPRVLWVAC